MLVVVIDLLCPLNIEQQREQISAAIDIFGHVIILNQLLNQPQVASDPTNVRMHLHITVHSEHRSWIGFNANVHQKSITRVQLLTKTIEKPVMRVEFSCLFVLYADEKVSV